MVVARRTVLSLPIVAALTAGASATVSSVGSSLTSAAAAVPQQSPVNIVRSAVQRRHDLPPLEIHYSRRTPVSVNYITKDDPSTGGCSARSDQETEEVDVRPGAGYVVLSGVRYDLLQFHFHIQSEHTVDGKHFPLEMHLVHRSAAGRRLVIGILLHAGEASQADRILAELPDECGQPIEIDDFDLQALLPANTSTLRYLGSLTTAPYSEDVQWFLTVPRTVTAKSIANFRAVFPDGDSRPSQPLNGRKLLADVHW